MTARSILCYQDPRLFLKASPVHLFDEQLKTLVTDMAETMYQAPGIGLAATQINVQKRVVVIDMSETQNNLLVFINPEVIKTSPNNKTWEEGCLSVPGIYDSIERPDTIRIRAQAVDGSFFELDANDLLSVCLQHEIDHLNGKVFVQYLPFLRQELITNKLKKQARKNKQSN